MKLFISTILLIISSFFLSSLSANEILKYKNLNNEQIEKIEEVWNYLDNLNPKQLKMSSKRYKQVSKFEKHFGFTFNGIKVKNWILGRIHSVYFENEKKFTATYHNKAIYLDKDFFSLSVLMRTLAIIHESRHADGDGFSHVRCPEGFSFISIRKPEVDLTSIEACDLSSDGPYGFSADFTFELIAHGIGDISLLAALYNSDISRIIITKER